MNFLLLVLFVIIGISIGLWLVSYIIEALRTIPLPPKKLRWAPDIPINYIAVDGYELRYIKSGHGPNLVLLHTLGT